MPERIQIWRKSLSRFLLQSHYWWYLRSCIYSPLIHSFEYKFQRQWLLQCKEWVHEKRIVICTQGLHWYLQEHVALFLYNTPYFVCVIDQFVCEFEGFGNVLHDDNADRRNHEKLSRLKNFILHRSNAEHLLRFVGVLADSHGCTFLLWLCALLSVCGVLDVRYQGAS